MRFNWPETADTAKDIEHTTVNVVKFPFMNDPESNKHLVWQSFQIAELTGAPTIILETSKPRNDGAGVFESDAKKDAETLKNLGVKSINIASNSMGSTGGMKLAAVAAQFGIRVETAHLSGEPNIEKRGLIKLFNDLSAQDNTYKSARQFPFDEKLNAAHEHSTDTTIQARRAYIKRIGIRSLAKYISAMKQNSFSADVEQAMHTQPNMKLVLVETGHDTVAKQSQVKKVKQDYAHIHPIEATRIKTRIFPDADHGLADAAFWPKNVALSFRK
jgi:hypothetical protein